MENKQLKVVLLAGLGIVVIALVAGLLIGNVLSDDKKDGSPGRESRNSSGSTAEGEPGKETIVEGKNGEKIHKTESGLQYIDDKEGTGQTAKRNDTVLVHYTGRLAEGGKKFDSSRDRGDPIEFTIGTRGIIQGWNIGIQGMKVGGKRTLIIPANLAYGAAGRPPEIPPNSDLIFDVELVKIK